MLRLWHEDTFNHRLERFRKGGLPQNEWHAPDDDGWTNGLLLCRNAARLVTPSRIWKKNIYIFSFLWSCVVNVVLTQRSHWSISLCMIGVTRDCLAAVVKQSTETSDLSGGGGLALSVTCHGSFHLQVQLSAPHTQSPWMLPAFAHTWCFVWLFCSEEEAFQKHHAVYNSNVAGFLICTPCFCLQRDATLWANSVRVINVAVICLRTKRLVSGLACGIPLY